MVKVCACVQCWNNVYDKTMGSSTVKMQEKALGRRLKKHRVRFGNQGTIFNLNYF